MPQDFASQELAAGGNTFTAAYASGTICPRTGSYKAQNNYMNAIVTVVKGAKFPNFIDGKKCTWTALSASTSTTNSDGGFESTRVAPGAA
jgi:phage host-nuclease inhibitor protein Gam